MTFRLTAPAKLNLFLHITGKRPDGYHLLESIMGPLALADEISAELSDSIVFSVTDGAMPAEDNLVIKAAEALRKKARIKKGAEITLTKSIPVGAGLGGGSADAAATLHILKKLWDVTLSEQEMEALALSLGADVPVCLRREPCFVTGIGEKLEPISLPSLPLVLLNPRKPLSTKEVFRIYTPAFSKTINPPPIKTIEECIAFLKGTKNDLEIAASQLMPEIGDMLSVINTSPHCLLARMSGSGATCFGIYPTMQAASHAAIYLRKRFPRYFVQATLFG